MSEQLTVRFFGGARVGTVAQRPDGALTVAGETPEWEAALRALIDRIVSQPVVYRSGKRVETVGGFRHVTIKKTAQPGTPEYLRALADHLREQTLLGKRIRGTVE